MKNIKLLIVDKKGNVTEIEINSLQFRSMGIDLSKVDKFSSKRELNKRITKFMEEE